MGKLTHKVALLLVTFLFFFSSSVVPVLAAITYLYDANGNMTSDGSKCYEYNQENQLVKVKTCSNSQTIAEYVYDYQGQRLVKKEYSNGTLQKKTYAPNDSYETVKLPNGTIQNTSYYFANDELIAKKNPDGSKNYIHSDHLGSTTVQTNQTGTVVESTQYDPWGEVLAGGTKNKFQYTGQEKDSETGLNYYNARYYDPHTRHFTQADDIIQDPYDPQSLNRYSYVKNNPVNYKDPSGHFAQALVILAPEFFLLGMEIGGFAQGAINSPNKTVGGRIESGILGSQRAVESPPGQLTLSAIYAILITFPGGYSQNSATSTINVTRQAATKTLPNTQGIVKQSSQVQRSPYLQLKGNEIRIGNNLRIAPLGNPGAKNKDGSANLAARLPHYHQKQTPKPNDKNARTSKDWHRPWETVFKKIFK